MNPRLGARLAAGGASFAVRAPAANAVTLCLFDAAGERQVPLSRAGELFVGTVAGIGAGQHYGYRVDGRWAPDAGLWHDPAKLLVDPYATRIDRPFVQDPRLAMFGEDTADLVPRAIVVPDLPPVDPAPPRFRPGGFIYELNVRGFTMLHPDVPEAQRGMLAALGHPAVIAHLRRLGVDAVELMPVVAWIDERHLPPLGLGNAWGYNPVVPMALDPRLAPDGVVDLREAVAALHEAGIGVILDLVFNHTGESDASGPILSLRGLANDSYAHAPDGTPINDTGTGNMLDARQPAVRAMVCDTMRHFVIGCGVDGFRFDLATVLARGPGFDRAAPIFAEIANDPVLADRVMIAEPWDIGPGGYQLGAFPDGWIEWNDRFRDDVRRFWRGDGSVGRLATRLAGSSDIFGHARSRSVNFVAAHDGFTLADMVSYAERHNEANGEDNRDGHAENSSWNGGVEGPTDDPAVRARRAADLRALIATLFASRGTIMLIAGDEFGRTQHGNNNAYAQDNAIGWIDWAARDEALEAFVVDLSRFRAAHRALGSPEMPDGIAWLALDGTAMDEGRWEDPACPGFEMLVPVDAQHTLSVRIDRQARAVTLNAVETVASGA